MDCILKWWPCLSRLQLAEPPAKLTAAEFGLVQLEKQFSVLKVRRGRGGRGGVGGGGERLPPAPHRHNANMEGSTPAPPPGLGGAAPGTRPWPTPGAGERPGPAGAAAPPPPLPPQPLRRLPHRELRHLGATSRGERSVLSAPQPRPGETSEGRRGGPACPGSPVRPRAGGGRPGPHTKAAPGGAMRALTGGGRTLQMPVCSAMGRILWMKAKGSANSSQLGSKTGHSGGGRNSAMARPGRPLRSALRTISTAAALRARPRGGRGWEKSPPGPGRGGGAAAPPRPRLCAGAPGPDRGGPVGGGGKRQRRLLRSGAWPARRRSHARYPGPGGERDPESAAHRGR